MEGQAIELSRGFEQRIDHTVEREILFERSFIEIESCFAHLLRIITPIPRLQLCNTVFLGKDQQIRFFLAGANKSRCDDLLEQGHRGVRCFRHRFLKHKMSVRRCAHQLCAFGPQACHFAD